MQEKGLDAFIQISVQINVISYKEAPLERTFCKVSPREKVGLKEMFRFGLSLLMKYMFGLLVI